MISQKDVLHLGQNKNLKDNSCGGFMINGDAFLSVWSDVFLKFFSMVSNDERNGIELVVSPMQDIEPNELA